MADFNWQSTTDDVLAGIDLTGRRAFVTGVSAGLGAETARTLVSHGAEVIGAARDLAKAQEATRGIGPGLTLLPLDLASLASVRACADAILADGRPLDLLIANAGIMATPEGRTNDGFELQLGTNHLGHFVLMNRLAGLMREGGRLISLSSSAHQFDQMDFEDPNYQSRPYDRFRAYGASKTANSLFAVEFDRRHKARGVRAAAVHPGTIVTELIRYMSQETIEEMSKLSAATKGRDVVEHRFKTVPQGAATTLWAAVTAPAELIGGRYCEDCHVAETASIGGEGVRPYAIDPERAQRLWSISEELVGERFPV